MAALLATRGKNFAAPLGLHARAKSVRLVSAPHFRLKGTFGQRVLLWAQPAGPKKRLVYSTPPKRSSNLMPVVERHIVTQVTVRCVVGRDRGRTGCCFCERLLAYAGRIVATTLPAFCKTTRTRTVRRLAVAARPADCRWLSRAPGRLKSGPCKYSSETLGSLAGPASRSHTPCG